MGASIWTCYVEDARSAVDVRSSFVEFLRSFACERDFIDRAELIFGELLANVVRHAPGPVEISVDSDGDSMVLHVVDSGPPLPSAKHRLPDDVLSERGRGLFIVEALAAAVAVEHVPNSGNHVRVKLA